MTVPGHPRGYNVTKDVPVSRNRCHITVGFDKEHNRIPRFLVRLHYMASVVPIRWTSIARFDHNETNPSGHDIYLEGLHVDASIAAGGEVKLHPSHSQLAQNRGTVIRACVEYFDREADYFVDVYTGDIAPGRPPSWPDGGNSPGTLFCPNHISGDMRPEPRGDDTVSKEELSDILADATSATAEEIERGAEELDIGPPEEADVVEVTDG